MVAPIDEQDVDRRARQRLGGAQAAESAADDDDARARRVRHGAQSTAQAADAQPDAHGGAKHERPTIAMTIHIATQAITQTMIGFHGVVVVERLTHAR